jgi:hypothetical protein
MNWPLVRHVLCHMSIFAIAALVLCVFVSIVAVWTAQPYAALLGLTGAGYALLGGALAGLVSSGDNPPK